MSTPAHAPRGASGGASRLDRWLDAGGAFVARHRRELVIAAVLLVAAIGFEALHLVLREVHLRDVRASLAAVPDTRIAASLALTVTSYLIRVVSVVDCATPRAARWERVPGTPLLDR